MSVVITILGAPNEKTLNSALAQNCDVAIIDSKYGKFPVKLVVVDNNSLFFKAASKEAVGYDYLYIMSNNTVLLDGCIEKQMKEINDTKLDTYNNYFTDYLFCDNLSSKQRLVYLTSIIDKKVDTGRNKLIKTSAIDNKELDELIYTPGNTAHLPIPTYLIG